MKVLRKIPFLLILILAACGYRVEGDDSSQGTTSVSIPYIKGDRDGLLINALAESLSSSSLFQYTYSGGHCILEASIIADGDDRVGFRYDRNPTTGELRDNIVGTENRRTLAVEIKLLEAHSDKVLFGPETIRVEAEYDYVDDNSIYDLVFYGNGSPQTVLNFSMGQLDSFKGGHDDTHALLYNRAAEKIVSRLVLHSHL